MDNIFFDSWTSTVRIAIITIMSYVVLIVVLRTSGKRTLSKMNAFDMIVTIALGSMLATVALNKNVPLLDGALGMFLLIYLQYAITWLCTRNEGFQQLVKSKPTLLIYRGEIFHAVLKRERITMEEIYEAARKHGCSSVAELQAVVLETTGELNVLKELGSQDRVMTSLEHHPQRSM